jgi:hypothetical protein
VLPFDASDCPTTMPNDPPPTRRLVIAMATLGALIATSPFVI